MLAGGMTALGVLGAISVSASALPPSAAWLMAFASLLEGLRLASRELDCPPRMLVWPIGGAPALDGARMDDVRLHWRGSLAFLVWRDETGRRRRLVWWPDTLDPTRRRELRLAAAAMPAAAGDRSMAP